ncbi:MAG: hypothetical protein SGARI_004551, partial [Bacillariaceae sp.]
MVEVSNTKVVEVSDASGDRINDKHVRNEARDVERLFSRIEAAVWQNLETMRVQYNTLYGYPISIHVEFSGVNAEDNFDTQVTSFAPFSKWKADLREAKREWTSHGLDHYEYSYHRQCEDSGECLPQFTEPMRIHVEDDTVKEAFYQDKHISVLQSVIDDGGAPTMDEVFDELEFALEELPHEWMVSYNHEYGYPVYAYVDFDKMKRDDELIIRCNEMVPLQELEEELELHKEVWERHGIVSYTYSFRRGCLGTLCSTNVGIELAKTHVIEVADKDVVRVDGIYLDATASGDGENTEVERARSSDVVFTTTTFPTIPDLFREIEDGLKNEAFRVDTTYDEEYGYPIRIWIDEIAGTSFDSSFSATVKLLSIEKKVQVTSGVNKRGGLD